MSRDLSNNLKQELFAQESGDPFLLLIEVSHPTDFATMYFAQNTEDVVSNGNTYKAFPVEIKLPDDTEESVPTIEMTFDNVSLELIDEFRQATSDVTFKLKGVLASLPDVVEIEYNELKLTNISYNATTLNATLAIDDLLSEGLTSEKYEPTFYAGIF